MSQEPVTYEQAVEEEIQRQQQKYEEECAKAREDAEKAWETRVAEHNAQQQHMVEENAANGIEYTPVELTESDKQNHMMNYTMMIQQPDSREHIEALYSFLKRPEINPAMEMINMQMMMQQSIPLEQSIYQIEERYYDIPTKEFIKGTKKEVQAAIEGRRVIDLNPNGTEKNLRETLEFYKLTVGWELLTLDECKANATKYVNNVTTEGIYKGFDCTINGVLYHFNFDTHDQQNFSDTAIMINQGAITDKVDWRVYKDGVATNVEFTPEQFMDIYVNGAQKYKSDKLIECRCNKIDIAACKTKEELIALVGKENILYK